jgi:hypothetical protein
MDLFQKQQDLDKPEKEEPGVLLYKGEEVVRFLEGNWKAHLSQLRAELEALKKSKPEPYPFLHGVADAARPRDLKIHLRGNPYHLGDEVPRRFPVILSNGEPAPLDKGSGRLQLAEAVIRHPLVARVAVNRVWHHHFGRGLVGTLSNFGQTGERPSHPELLEYLASQFVRGGMSLKKLHREILLSATYQLSSEFSAQNFAKDGDNRFYWRANRRRLDAEALRDSLLFVSGALDGGVGGPSIDLSGDSPRRTVYAAVSRYRLDPYLRLFDFPEPSLTSEKRNVTLVPLQRLFFMNSGFVAKQADQLARRLAAEPSEEARIRSAYRILYNREPSGEELRLGIEFLTANGASEGSPAWRQYARVLLSTNEFEFVN